MDGIGLWRWKVQFVMGLVARRKTLHRGFLRLDPDARRVDLLDAELVRVDIRDLCKFEVIHSGSTVYFPCHVALVGPKIPRRSAFPFELLSSDLVVI